MSRIVKILVSAFVVVLFVVVSAISYLAWGLPDVEPAPELGIKASPEMLIHGKYLFDHVAACSDCHTQRDWNRYGGPIKEELYSGGGEPFPREWGFPGNIYSSNLTPAGLGDWTDGEIFRAITSGVDRDGNALFPLMPYHHYGRLDSSDIVAIIAYMRTLPPIETVVPERELDFPVNLIVNTIPVPPAFSERPDPSDVTAYGEYLTRMANCTDCHTPVDEQANPLPGMYLAGGRQFPLPGGLLSSPNITPHEQTGIGLWDEDDFVDRFKMYADSSYSPPAVSPGSFNTIMPWHVYSGMTDTDLRAVFAYLRSVKPIENEVNSYKAH